jgi:hypothetical protein
MTFSSEVRRSKKIVSRVSALSTVRCTRLATKETSITALREIRRESAHVALLHSSLMRTWGMAAQLTPIFGCPHRSIPRGVRCGHLTLSGGLALAIFKVLTGEHPLLESHTKRGVLAGRSVGVQPSYFSAYGARHWTAGAIFSMTLLNIFLSEVERFVRPALSSWAALVPPVSPRLSGGGTRANLGVISKMGNRFILLQLM